MPPTPRQLPESTEALSPALEPPAEVIAAEAAPPPERVPWVDWAMVGLAVLSLGLVIAEQVAPTYLHARPDVLRWLVIADLAICGVFALELLVRVWPQPRRWAYLKSRWYEVLGMIPVSHPLFRGFRLLRILRIVVVTSRFVRATNRSFGEMLFESTVRRFRNILVDVVGGAVMVRGVAMVEPWLVQARFAERIGDALEGRREEIRRMVHAQMGKMPGATLLALPPMRKAVINAEEAAVQAVIDVLKSNELNAVVQQSTQNVLAELRSKINDSERRRGMLRA